MKPVLDLMQALKESPKPTVRRRCNEKDTAEIRRLVAWYDGIAADYVAARQMHHVAGDLAEPWRLERLEREARTQADRFRELLP